MILIRNNPKNPVQAFWHVQKVSIRSILAFLGLHSFYRREYDPTLKKYSESLSCALVFDPELLERRNVALLLDLFKTVYSLSSVNKQLNKILKPVRERIQAIANVNRCAALHTLHENFKFLFECFESDLVFYIDRHFSGFSNPTNRIVDAEINSVLSAIAGPNATVIRVSTMIRGVLLPPDDLPPNDESSVRINDILDGKCRYPGKKKLVMGLKKYHEPLIWSLLGIYTLFRLYEGYCKNKFSNLIEANLYLLALTLQLFFSLPIAALMSNYTSVALSRFFVLTPNDVMTEETRAMAAVYRIPCLESMSIRQYMFDLLSRKATVKKQLAKVAAPFNASLRANTQWWDKAKTRCVLRAENLSGVGASGPA